MSPASTATEVPKGVPEERLDALFRGPLEEFTQARNALAKELRAEGSAEAADWVKALRKPTRAAWLVNQLAERKPEEVKGLIEVGGRLREAQEEMLAGSADREALRDAARREQEGIDSLLRTAEAIGREHGVGAQILDRVGETLQAASSDPEVARAIELGRLEREQRAVSTGLIGAPAPARGKGKGAAERRAREGRARRRKAAERKLASAEKRLERERAAADRAREALAEREQRLRDAEHDLRAARRELDEKGKGLDSEDSEQR